ncbi:hypothetical protein HYQ46_012211 [Verticillium longisporum]|nr:hypothetical protein HYQ46_012211 [Verticillium longisporum]
MPERFFSPLANSSGLSRGSWMVSLTAKVLAGLLHGNVKIGLGHAACCRASGGLWSTRNFDVPDGHKSVVARGLSRHVLQSQVAGNASPLHRVHQPACYKGSRLQGNATDFNIEIKVEPHIVNNALQDACSLNLVRSTHLKFSFHRRHHAVCRQALNVLE